MKKKKSMDLENLKISELMLIRADWQRTFVAEFCREITSEGVSIVRGSVVVNEGKIWSRADTQEELGKYLDDISILKLDYCLHLSHGVITDLSGMSFHMN
jgi:hypothetical protein